MLTRAGHQVRGLAGEVVAVAAALHTLVLADLTISGETLGRGFRVGDLHEAGWQGHPACPGSYGARSMVA